MSKSVAKALRGGIGGEQKRGISIVGYAVGANMGFIYVRAEYPLAVEHLEIAIAQARDRGLLGRGILGSDFGFDIELRLGSGAFVCGEGTALIEVP